MSEDHILVVDDNELSARMVAELLDRRGYSTTIKHDPLEALSWLRVPGDLPDLIVLDLMMPGMSGYEFLRQVRADPAMAHLPVIMLTAKGQMDHKVAGFEAGADDYLVKPVNAVELEIRVKSLLARMETVGATGPRPQATVIAVFSLRGGVGTTSIAVNLAGALGALWGLKVPLLDMAFKNGHCGLMLNLKPKHTIADLVEWEDDTVDPEVVENLLVTHKSGISLLPAPESPLDADLITVAVLDQAWPYLRSRYRFMVVDAGSELSEVTLAILERAHVVALVLTPELASLKAATDALRIFERLGLEGSRVFPVINWTFPRDGLPQRSIENALGAKAKEAIPHERTAFVRAINSGRPLITTDPAAEASLAIARLAYRSSAAEMETQEITNPSQLLTMVRQLVRAR